MHWEGAPPAGCINKPIQLNVAPALPNVPALLQQCRRQQHPLLIRWSCASEAGSLLEKRWRWKERGGVTNGEGGRKRRDICCEGEISKKMIRTYRCLHHSVSLNPSASCRLQSHPFFSLQLPPPPSFSPAVRVSLSIHI